MVRLSHILFILLGYSLNSVQFVNCYEEEPSFNINNDTSEQINITNLIDTVEMLYTSQMIDTQNDMTLSVMIDKLINTNTNIDYINKLVKELNMDLIDTNIKNIFRVRNNSKCSNCIKLINLIMYEEKHINGTIISIIDFIKSVCENVNGPRGKECVVVIDNIKNIIDWIGEGISPNSICKKLNLCYTNYSQL